MLSIQAVYAYCQRSWCFNYIQCDSSWNYFVTVLDSLGEKFFEGFFCSLKIHLLLLAYISAIADIYTVQFIDKLNFKKIYCWNILIVKYTSAVAFPAELQTTG